MPTRQVLRGGHVPVRIYTDDEIPAAYKDIDAVMANQNDLVEIIHSLKQVLTVKG
jgi:RNA-splicing ligase RtcB